MMHLTTDHDHPGYHDSDSDLPPVLGNPGRRGKPGEAGVKGEPGKRGRQAEHAL